MNIARICLTINKRIYNMSKLKIDEYIINRYCKNVVINDKDRYCELLSNEWSKYGSNIRSLYSKDDIIALGETNRIKYYLINEYNKRLLSENQVSLDVLIIYDNEDIDYTINEVIKHIKKVVKFTKVKVIHREEIRLYIKNDDKTDISSTFTYIKANFTKKPKLYKPELVQFIIVLIISIIGLNFALENIFNSNITNVLIGIGSSGIVFDASLLIIRICEIIRRDEKITIKDLNNLEINQSVPKSKMLNSDMGALPGNSGSKFVDMAEELENFDPEEEENEN